MLFRSSGTLTISGPAGWTRLGTDVAGATGTLLQSLWWKAATATDAGRAATWTFSGSIRSAGVIYAVAGATTSLPGAEQYKSSANPFSVAVINTPTLSLGAARTGMAVVFGAMQTGSSELSVGTGYSIPSSGGSFAVSGGKGTTQIAIGSGYSGLITDSTIYPTTITMSAAGMNVGSAIFLDQVAP